jgi:hypothetical protein
MAISDFLLKLQVKNILLISVVLISVVFWLMAYFITNHYPSATVAAQLFGLSDMISAVTMEPLIYTF